MPRSGAELERAVLASLAPLPVASGNDRGGAGSYPRINIGRTSIHDWASGADTGEHRLTVHVWSKSNDEAEATAVMDVVRSRLAGARLDIGGGVVARINLEFEQLRHEVEFAGHHGLLRFRARLEENA